MVKAKTNTAYDPLMLEKFFANFNLYAKTETKPLSTTRMSLIITTAVHWHGIKFGKYVLRCFAPTGKATKQGNEDIYSQYQFTYPEDNMGPKVPIQKGALT